MSANRNSPQSRGKPKKPRAVDPEADRRYRLIKIISGLFSWLLVERVVAEELGDGLEIVRGLVEGGETTNRIFQVFGHYVRIAFWHSFGAFFTSIVVATKRLIRWTISLVERLRRPET